MGLLPGESAAVDLRDESARRDRRARPVRGRGADRRRPRRRADLVRRRGRAPRTATAPAAPRSTRCARAERRSRPGDTDRGPASRPQRAPLDGGIALKPRQRLIGAGRSVRGAGPAPRPGSRTRTRDAAHGDAVVLADGATVRNLEIVGRRGAAASTGRTSAGSGSSATTSPGTTLLHRRASTSRRSSSRRRCRASASRSPRGCINGWAGIMVDVTRGRARARASRGNRVHDADCGDGIDIRASGTRERARRRSRRNAVSDLRQGEAFESLLAIGLQARDRSRLVAPRHRQPPDQPGQRGGLRRLRRRRRQRGHLRQPGRARPDAGHGRPQPLHEPPRARRLLGQRGRDGEHGRRGSGAGSRSATAASRARRATSSSCSNFGADGRLQHDASTRVTATRSTGSGNTW